MVLPVRAAPLRISAHVGSIRKFEIKLLYIKVHGGFISVSTINNKFFLLTLKLAVMWSVKNL